VHCSYHAAGRCRSCTLLERPCSTQVDDKHGHCRDLLREHADLEWLSPVTGAEDGFRNKAKMVVSGTVEQPVLGILDADGHGVDLRDCPLYPPPLQASFAPLAEFVTRARLAPYDVTRRTGELKHLLVTASPAGEVMVRFVLRSQESVARIRKHLPALRAALPGLAVASVNLLPEHKAALEGEREILLTEQESLPMQINGIALHLRPQSFFQTNTEVAAALYRLVRDWVDECAPASVWDLYCGVGGFALHCAHLDRDVTGVEASPEAVTSARTSARRAGLPRVRFEVGDATTFAASALAAPELVIVNPPRRGIGAELCAWLDASPVRHVIYSSCNAESLAHDLRRIPSLRPRRARLLDMFPHTEHYEVAALLERR
jgi:23S rRNA (uracil747-C5)-methyltransferase